MNLFPSQEESNTGPRDVFLHLLETLALYIAVGSFFALFFGYINLQFPDVLDIYSIESVKDSLRWPLATLVVIFPFYLWLTRYLQNNVDQNPEKQKLKTRRWLLHLTPSLAVIIIIGDLITLIFNFLSGGLTTPFLLKVLAVFVITAIVLVYYGWILKNERPPHKDEQMKIFTRLVAGLGIAAILSGFFIIDSPFEERAQRFDQQRVNDLQTIQHQIINHWQNTDQLPEELSELRNEISGFVPPSDPQTGQPYEYRTTGELSFELCAKFETQSTENSPQSAPRLSPKIGDAESVWNHPSGEHCFDRTIDPEQFPRRNN